MDGREILRRALRLWEIPFLAALAAFMLWIRLKPYDALVGGDTPYYIGTDPFYHYRETLGIVRSFPDVPRFDPYTQYPLGTGTGQFGSLFDWLTALVVVVTAGRGASETYVGQVLGAMPAFMGALLVVPLYFLAKRLLGTPGAVVAAITIALLPGEFLIRSIAGYADHHVAEALFCLVSILGVVVAVEKARARADRFADLRDGRRVAPALAWGLLGGAGLWLNYLAWPPAVLFLGILAIWLTVVVLLEHAKGNAASARAQALVGAASFAVSAILMVPFVESTFLGEFNNFGVLHVVAGLVAAAWLVALDAGVAALARRAGPRRAPGGVGLAVA
ncbi:MAG TPA: STT3 domain-containing protein, partial [Candidatus Thermoplasmatota archaeon]|nr:STT3 domain-containing protein [Candidatus Thermoplasmatota archaeon]